MNAAKLLDTFIAWFIGTKHENTGPSRRTRLLEGVLASKNKRNMSFREIREAAAKAAYKRDSEHWCQ